VSSNWNISVGSAANSPGAAQSTFNGQLLGSGDNEVGKIQTTVSVVKQQ
jgi:hypothetical protein